MLLFGKSTGFNFDVNSQIQLTVVRCQGGGQRGKEMALHIKLIKSSVLNGEIPCGNAS